MRNSTLVYSFILLSLLFSFGFSFSINLEDVLEITNKTIAKGVLKDPFLFYTYDFESPIYISDSYDLFYKNEKNWFLYYDYSNFDSSSNESFPLAISSSPYDVEKISEVDFSNIDLFKSKVSSYSNVLFSINESLTSKPVATSINLVRFFKPDGLFFDMKIRSGTPQGSNSEKITLENASNYSLLFYFEQGDKKPRFENNVVFLQDNAYLNIFSDYLILKLINVSLD